MRFHVIPYIPILAACIMQARVAAYQVTCRARAVCLTEPAPTIEILGDEDNNTSLTFAVVDQEFKITGLPVHEFWTYGGALSIYNWSISPNGGTGEIKESYGMYDAPVTAHTIDFPDGVSKDGHNAKLISANDYTITFSGTVVYYIGWTDENNEYAYEGPLDTPIQPYPNSDSLSVDFTFYDISLITPAGDPVEAPKDSGEGQNEFTFNNANPGKLTIELKAKVSPGSAAGYAASEADFEVSEIAGSTLSWKLTEDKKIKVKGDTLEATAEFKNLPTNNSAFGSKTATLTYEFKNKTNPYEVFFHKTATNHPECTVENCENCPNWFYYWKQGNVCSIPITAVFDSSSDYYGWCQPNTDSIIRLGALAAETNSGPETYSKADNSTITVTGEGNGIQCVAETVVHENNHIFLYNLLQGRADNDSDGIANDDEPTLQDVNTDENLSDTYQMGGDYITYGDNEIRCRNMEKSELSYNARADWANPGCQSKNQFGPIVKTE